jgi:hypothetical protein
MDDHKPPHRQIEISGLLEIRQYIPPNQLLHTRSESREQKQEKEFEEFLRVPKITIFEKSRSRQHLAVV